MCGCDDCCVFSLVTDVHCVVRVVRSTEFSDTSFIWSDGERVCGTALVLKVVTEETKSGPSVLVHELGQVPCVETCVGVTGCDRSGSTTCCCKDCCTLGSTEVVFHHGRELLVLLHTVEVDFSTDVVDNFLGWLDFVVRVRVGNIDVVLVVDVVHTVVDEVVEDVISVCCSCVLSESDTTRHVGTEPDLVKEDCSCTDNFKGCLCWVVRVDTVCLDHICEVTEENSSWLVWTACTACWQGGCHVDDTCVLCCEGKVCDCCFSCAHTVCCNEGHTDLHCGPAGGSSTITGSSDDGWHVDTLPEGLADCCLECFCLLLREELLDVDDVLGVERVCEFLVTSEDTDVTVIG